VSVTAGWICISVGDLAFFRLWKYFHSRKDALFYRTLHGAQVGDLFMSLIHTCQLCEANSFDYLVELQRHARELAACPAEWMPWNYRETLARIGGPDSAEL
jgi:transposase